MRRELDYFFLLIKRLLIIVLIFSIIRFLFYLYNKDFFPNTSLFSFLSLFGNALRFDLAAIIYINALFILSCLFPFPIRKEHWFQNIQKALFLGFNGIAIAFEMIDIGFFKFAFRRTIVSDLSLMKNTAGMIPEFLFEFWYLTCIFILLILIINYLYNYTESDKTPNLNRWIPQSIIFILGISLAAITARGGFQLRPVMSITAAQYVDDMRLMPLMTNTSLNLIFSSQQRLLEKKNYFDDVLLDQIYSIQKRHIFPDSFERKNVVIIVLESFGKEYISTYNQKANYTTFLDSLIGQSFSCTQSYANGLRSTQGIVAISSSIPALMNDPLMFSAYQSNRVDGLAKLLKDEGYFTAFFHGANPGSMEFERFSKLTGFEHYFDREDYGNEDYDGQWGIWDEPYFQYTAEQLTLIDAPFCALLFSLTSHHPYKVPKWFEKQYPNEAPVFRSIRYTDHALAQFFETARSKSWYQNTLFVITADHIGKSFDPAYKTYKGLYEIPILLFDPSSDLNTNTGSLAQQIDIMPTVLDYLNYPKPYKSFGTNMLDSTSRHYSYMFTNNIFQIIDEEHLLLFENERVLGLYDHLSDPFLYNNLRDSLPVKKFELETRLKAVIQAHHKAMIENTLYGK